MRSPQTKNGCMPNVVQYLVFVAYMCTFTGLVHSRTFVNYPKVNKLGVLKTFLVIVVLVCLCVIE